MPLSLLRLPEEIKLQYFAEVNSDLLWAYVEFRNIVKFPILPAETWGSNDNKLWGMLIAKLKSYYQDFLESGLENT